MEVDSNPGQADLPHHNDNFFWGKKILVAGGTGMIGIPLVKRLVGLGADVSVVSLESPAYAQTIFGDMVHFIKSDLTQYAACEEAVKEQEMVFNLVGIRGSVGIGTSRAASYLVPMLRYQTNLMEAAFLAKASRYLFVSSICAYPQSDFHEEDNMWNGMPKQNDRYAGIAKRVGEVQAEAYLQEYGWEAVKIVRPSNVYGPFDDFNPATAQVIAALIRRALDGENPLTVWGDGSAVRDFLFSEDLVDGLLLATEKAPACVPINLGCGSGVTIRQLAETVVRCVPTTPSLQWDTAKPSGDPIRLLSTKRAEELLGFKAKTSLQDGIRQTIQWYLDNPALAQLRKNLIHASN
jgi:GDP-L-fucose synthase